MACLYLSGSFLLDVNNLKISVVQSRKESVPMQTRGKAFFFIIVNKFHWIAASHKLCYNMGVRRRAVGGSVVRNKYLMLLCATTSLYKYYIASGILNICVFSSVAVCPGLCFKRPQNPLQYSI